MSMAMKTCKCGKSCSDRDEMCQSCAAQGFRDEMDLRVFYGDKYEENSGKIPDVMVVDEPTNSRSIGIIGNPIPIGAYPTLPAHVQDKVQIMEEDNSEHPLISGLLKEASKRLTDETAQLKENEANKYYGKKRKGSNKKYHKRKKAKNGRTKKRRK